MPEYCEQLLSFSVFCHLSSALSYTKIFFANYIMEQVERKIIFKRKGSKKAERTKVLVINEAYIQYST